MRYRGGHQLILECFNDVALQSLALGGTCLIRPREAEQHSEATIRPPLKTLPENFYSTLANCAALPSYNKDHSTNLIGSRGRPNVGGCVEKPQACGRGAPDGKL